VKKSRSGSNKWGVKKKKARIGEETKRQKIIFQLLSPKEKKQPTIMLHLPKSKKSGVTETTSIKEVGEQSLAGVKREKLETRNGSRGANRQKSGKMPESWGERRKIEFKSRKQRGRVPSKSKKQKKKVTWETEKKGMERGKNQNRRPMGASKQKSKRGEENKDGG